MALRSKIIKLYWLQDGLKHYEGFWTMGEAKKCVKRIQEKYGNRVCDIVIEVEK